MPKEEYIYNYRACLFALLGCGVAAGLYLLFRKIWPIEPYHCADGWFSSSIGIQGACSHHGGVVGGDSMPWQMKVVAPVFGLGVFWYLLEKFHGYTSVVVGKYGADTIGQLADKFEKAIALRRSVEFVYTRKGDNYVGREIVVPHRLFYVKPGIKQTLCVNGWCRNKKAGQSFLLACMSDVKIRKAA